MSRRAEGKPFSPKGAIATFVAMIVFYVVLWSVVYFIMAQRG